MLSDGIYILDLKRSSQYSRAKMREPVVYYCGRVRWQFVRRYVRIRVSYMEARVLSAGSSVEEVSDALRVSAEQHGDQLHLPSAAFAEVDR